VCYDVIQADFVACGNGENCRDMHFVKACKGAMTSDFFLGREVDASSKHGLIKIALRIAA
jgi:hypothetical protein